MKTRGLIRIVLFIIMGVFVLIQFIPNELPKNKADNPNDIIANGPASIEVGKILKTSCYDCHSNEVNYPWYSYVAPVSWLIAHDVEEGREELNFSEWTSFDQKRMIKKLEEMAEEIEEKKMPLSYYTTLHGNAELTSEQRELLIQWTRELRESVINE